MASPRGKARRARPKEGKEHHHAVSSDHKGSGKGKKSGKADSSSAKAKIAEEVQEEEEEEAEDDALLAGKKKRKKRPQSRKKGKAQPTTSAAHDAEGVDDDGFAYSAVVLPAHMASQDDEWCLKGAKEAAGEDSDGTVMILDTGCTKAMCSRHAFYYMKHGLCDGQVEQWNCCRTRGPSPLRMVSKLWRERSAEPGSPMIRLCSQTCPLSMKVRSLNFLCPFCR